MALPKLFWAKPPLGVPYSAHRLTNFTNAPFVYQVSRAATWKGPDDQMDRVAAMRLQANPTGAAIDQHPSFRSKRGSPTESLSSIKVDQHGQSMTTANRDIRNSSDFAAHPPHRAIVGGESHACRRCNATSLAGNSRSDDHRAPSTRAVARGRRRNGSGGENQRLGMTK
jgi:hypothetical protein